MRSQLVRLSKQYKYAGLLLCGQGSISVAAAFFDEKISIGGSIFILLMGISMVIYFLPFSITYDNNGFWLSLISKQRVCYQYREIQTQ